MNLSRIILLLIVLISSSVSSQTKQDLENQKKQIQEDIKKIELKLKTNSKQKKLIVSNAEDINYKIKLQENLINNINGQLNLILREIDRNENRLSNLKQRELTLKDELSKMNVLRRIISPMGTMDGIEFLERKMKSDSYCPIIMISGHGNVETAVQALKKGAYDYIEKPLDLNMDNIP